MACYVFHDYETFNLSPLGGAASQYAAIRTDKLFCNTTELNLFCKASPDTMPEIGACLTTGQTPSSVNSNPSSLCEYDFTRRINDFLLAESGTTSVGYNSLSFDDEWTRHLFFRNLTPPYDWHFKNGNSRYDGMLLMMATYALRNSILKWPLVESTTGDGLRPSMKLEHLAKENQVSHENAHDALSDVIALKELMKIVAEADSVFFEEALSIKDKAKVHSLLSDKRNARGLIRISRLDKDTDFIGYIVPICLSPTDKNVFWAWDAKVNPDKILSLPENVRSGLMSMDKGQLESLGIDRRGLIKIKMNKLPNLFSKTVFDKSKSLGSGLSAAKEMISANINDAISRVSELCGLIDLVESVPPVYEDLVDYDMRLYSETFLSKLEAAFCVRFASAGSWESRYKLLEQSCPTDRIRAIGFRLIGRNAHHVFNAADMDKWSLYLKSRFDGGVDNCPLNDSSRITAKTEVNRLMELRTDLDSDSRISIVNELIEYYSEKI